jgi:hypothetical protein
VTITIGTEVLNGLITIGEDSITVDDCVMRGIDWSQVNSTDIDITAERRRAARKAAFVLMDKWQLKFLYESLTPEQQTEFAAYRQAWLDYPSMSPDAPAPVIPAWMK